MEYEEYKSLVCAKAREILKDKPWYSGVCTDTIRNSHYEGDSIEDAVQRVVDDTTYWDAN